MVARLAHCNVGVRFVEPGSSSSSFSSRWLPSVLVQNKTDSLKRQEAEVKAEVLCVTALLHPGELLSLMT